MRNKFYKSQQFRDVAYALSTFNIFEWHFSFRFELAVFCSGSYLVAKLCENIFGDWVRAFRC
jgi:hypothetical protein